MGQHSKIIAIREGRKEVLLIIFDGKAAKALYDRGVAQYGRQEFLDFEMGISLETTYENFTCAKILDRKTRELKNYLCVREIAGEE